MFFVGGAPVSYRGLTPYRPHLQVSEVTLLLVEVIVLTQYQLIRWRTLTDELVLCHASYQFFAGQDGARVRSARINPSMSNERPPCSQIFCFRCPP